MPLVAVAVIAVAGFAVYRLNGVFGANHSTATPGALSDEIKKAVQLPSTWSFEVFGPPGTVATINYVDVEAQPQRVDNATLPWSYDTTNRPRGVFVNVMAQGDSHSIGCWITIDDVVKDENGQHVERVHVLLDTSPDERGRRGPRTPAASPARSDGLSVPIVLFWLVVAAITNVLVPHRKWLPAQAHNVALSSPDALSLQAFKRIGAVLTSSIPTARRWSSRGRQTAGPEAHAYDTSSSESPQTTSTFSTSRDFWGDSLTAAGSQSPDAKAAHAAAGNQGEASLEPSTRSATSSSAPRHPASRRTVTGARCSRRSPTSSRSATRAPPRSRC